MSDKFVTKAVKKKEYTIDSFSKFKSSNATINEFRTAIYAPVAKIASNSLTGQTFKKKGKITRKTSWGSVILEGVLLTQVHRNLLDCIFACADESTDYLKTPSDTTVITFTASKILEAYGAKNTRNTSWLEKNLSARMSAVIKIQDNKGNHYSFQVLSGSGFSKDYNSYHIEFSPRYQRFFDNNITINYKDKVKDLLKIKSPLLQAIIRLSLTHDKALNMSLYDTTKDHIASSGVLESIGFPIESERMRQNATKEIRENRELLAEYGIFYNPDKKNNLKYKRILDIVFVPPTTKPELKKLDKENQDAYLRIINVIGRVLKQDDKLRRIENVMLKDKYLQLEIINESNNESKVIDFNCSPAVAEELIYQSILSLETVDEEHLDGL